MLAAGELGDEVEVRGQLLALADEGPLALRATVTLVIGPDDHGALGDEPFRHVLVAADVLAVAVGEQDEESRVGVRPSADMEPPPRPLDLRGDH